MNNMNNSFNNNQKSNEFSNLLENISNNEKDILTKIYGYIQENIALSYDIKRQNKIKMLGLLYAIYLSTIATLEDQIINDEKLKIVYSIFSNKSNENKTDSFKNSIKSLEKLYSQLKDEKNNKK